MNMNQLHEKLYQLQLIENKLPMGVKLTKSNFSLLDETKLQCVWQLVGYENSNKVFG